MVLRFLSRATKLVSSLDKEHVHTLGLLKILGSLFVKLSLEVDQNKQIIDETIEVIHMYFSESTTNTINHTEGGESIIYLLREMQWFSQRIPGMLKYILKSDQTLRTDLCNGIIIRLKHDLNIEDSKDEYMGYITCLCYLLLENCDEEQTQFFPHLIEVLNSIENASFADLECFILIITTLSKYSCSDASIAKYLLGCNIVEALVAQLKWAAGIETPTFDFKHSVGEGTDPFIVPMRPIASGLASCIHPFNSTKHSGETGSTESESNLPTMAAVKCPCSDKTLIYMMRTTLVDGIINLIENYLSFHPSMPEVASEGLLLVLLHHSMNFGRFRMYQLKSLSVATALVKSPNHMVHLMGTSVVEKINEMMKSQHPPSCDSCGKLHYVKTRILRCFDETAQSEVGQKTIVHAMETCSDDQNARLVLTIPYVIRNESLLAYILLEYDGVDTLLQLLKDRPFLRPQSSKVIHMLVSRKKIGIGGTPQVALAPVGITIEETRLVTFKLDDGFSLQCNRHLLIRASWYFATLLDGNFKESKQDEVILHDVEHASLRFVLHLLTHPQEIDQMMMKSNLDVLLGAIVVTDRFLLEELRRSLVNYVKENRMTSETVTRIYRWSISLTLHLLREKAVVFALANYSDDVRIELFDRLPGVDYAEELLSDVRMLLEVKLRTLIKESDLVAYVRIPMIK